MVSQLERQESQRSAAATNNEHADFGDVFGKGDKVKASSEKREDPLCFASVIEDRSAERGDKKVVAKPEAGKTAEQLKFEERVQTIADDISNQKSEPISIPESFKKTVNEMRAAAKDRKEFDSKFTNLCWEVNSKLNGKDEAFLEPKLSADGSLSVDLLRFKNWRDLQSSMMISADHTPLTGSQSDLEANQYLEQSKKRDGHKIDFNNLTDKDEAHLKSQIGRAYYHLSSVDFKSYLDKLTKESGGNVYYKEGKDWSWNENLRVFTSGVLGSKLFDRNDKP